MCEHAWTTGRFPRAHLGVALSEVQELGDIAQQAEDFAVTFKDRWLGSARRMDDYPKDRSLIGVGMTLSGPPGRGKTTLACAIATSVLIVHHATVYFATVYFAPAADYATAYTARFSDRLSDEERLENRTMFQRAEAADLLVLDDIGAEHTSNTRTAQDEFARLLRHRFREARPTILTTNLGPNGWAEIYGAATADFLHEAAPTIVMNGDNLRRKRL